ncbi:MAG: hypothetical protein A2268_11985 [Candidatus Raymondbacteria bacterium RifOxyA12_full_50_37]|uniref:Glycoside hydrolase family 20 catalytic domain-containing protein n=1 Tax=Candidatus Raymondbacteria bacterium RIFOXYD12_FULL_49_13 TaxID=1817890 RepID=A0A1F7FGP7_UNCRA|nr:MAG: hypothetical protein A2268_11985 [Candidatus Raymondbacteria bacterium RifOxyA12_full_50_37]OGJ91699.1 MAG: hypothetical protein A2248_08050 [Candidatus Raymondbacteria bacterium RIFOXYA2_FULL_49_16]OGJ98710.1 MAG: hypothetical protein A2453_08215 [Candidatus Raymondbacteria bacterium RIFOXYC2_FULL_50_21]OGK01516.1 MAG: hypothetical protein A2487_13360 [Candidatus Raymondbacteria bacterium RifOxyC12_full_50_8]OGK05793.1 MAG: hypothetical protein A2519_01750 [Candidatus Raymondbacteria b
MPPQTSTFSVRGFHLDLRIQVMTLNALKEMARKIKDFGLNTLIMEWEASYPFQKHPIIPSANAYTPKEVNDFLNHCTKLNLDVIPLQQCFGHVEYILRHTRYAALREDKKDICQLCPLKPGQAAELFSDLFAELCKTHDSKYLHIGCDETYLLGKCPDCSAKALKKGKSKLFVDYVKVMCKIVKDLGRRPIIWADMLLAHPEAAADLPKDIVLVDWNYGWAMDHFGDPAPLLKTGLEFWGAPALRSHPDDHFLVSYEKHLRNFSDFIPYARRTGYKGVILTSWSTSGIYGFEWAADYEPIEMHTIRRVFPLKGCHLLLAAFVTAINQDSPLDPSTFAENYAQERFNLTPPAARAFREALFSDPTWLTQSKTSDNRAIAGVLSNVSKARAVLAKITPAKNRNEFDLFKLYFDIRVHYLAFKAIEVETQSASFKNKDIPKTLRDLAKLLNRADALDKAFARAFKGYLYGSEIRTENWSRKRKMKLLFERLSRQRSW